MKNEKIVVVTAGGHVSCFHASMRVMSILLEGSNYELWGAKKGCEGLFNGRFEKIEFNHLDKRKAGSLIGADRNNPTEEEIARIPEIMKNENIRALVMMGGDNHLGVASRVYKNTGARIVGWPKTMDGDLNSGVTLGYSTAATVGAVQVRNHHATAMTYDRVFYVGLFGRNTDWVACGAGAWGGADLIIPCEQEYEWKELFEKVKGKYEKNNERYGRPFAVVAFSEGAKIRGLKGIPKEYESFDKHGLPKLRPDILGLELERMTKLSGIESVCSQAHTYDLRDSPPSKADEILAAGAGESCMEMIFEEDYGKCPVFEPTKDFYRVVRKPLEEVAVQRAVKGTGYFDYENLRATDKFIEDYGRLFDRDLGKAPKKDELVYRNML